MCSKKVVQLQVRIKRGIPGAKIRIKDHWSDMEKQKERDTIGIKNN